MRGEMGKRLAPRSAQGVAERAGDGCLRLHHARRGGRHAHTHTRGRRAVAPARRAPHPEQALHEARVPRAARRARRALAACELRGRRVVPRADRKSVV